MKEGNNPTESFKTNFMKNRICFAFLCTFGTSLLFSQEVKEILHFDYDSYALTDQADEQLDAFIQKLDQDNLRSIKIIGHTDGDGSNQYNQTLSKNRAETVKNRIRKMGIDPSKIKYDFKGEEVPVASNQNNQGKQSNRRVEIEVVYFPEFKIPEALIVKPLHYRIHPSYDTILKVGRSESYMDINRNTFLSKNGNLLNDTVDIYFTEYRNSAEIMFSGIPMTFTKDEEEFVMSSGGMFELMGSFEGQKITIARNKTISLDYDLAIKDSSMHFYQLDDEKNNWEDKLYMWRNGKSKFQYSEYLYRKQFSRELGRYEMEKVYNHPRIERAKKLESRLLNNYVRKRFQILRKEHDEKRFQKANQLTEKFLFRNKLLIDRGRLITCDSFVIVNDGYYEVFEDPAPDIMKNLKIERFGKYNCDLAFRLPNNTHVTAKFIDENKNEIKALAYLSLVDPNYNGAISFYDPKQFNCNREAKNILALFTKDGQLFICDGKTFADIGIKSDGNYTIPVKNMTEELKSTEDLAEFLGINI